MIGRVFKFKDPSTELGWRDHLGAYGEIWVKVIKVDSEHNRFEVKMYAKNGSGRSALRDFSQKTLDHCCELDTEILKPFEEWL